MSSRFRTYTLTLFAVFVFPGMVFAASLFHPAVNYASGATGPAAIAVGDFNEDGIPDLAVANSNLFGDGTRSVAILLGRGNGRFGKAVNNACGDTPRAIAVGDFNHDGHLDLAVTNQLSFNVGIMLGNGDGTFQKMVFYPAGNEPFAIATADLNGDGHLDLVVSNFIARGRFRVLLGNGDGTFQPFTIFALGQHIRIHQILLLDLNGDGKIDLLAASAGINNNPGAISVRLGNGDGTFQDQVNYFAGGNPFSVAVADLNGDGKMDLAVADETDSTVSVLLGDGKGKFGAAQAFNTGTLPFSVAIADIDGDGKPDILTANENTNDVAVLLGKGNGKFASAVSVPVDQAPQALIVDDFNHDGLPDVAVANLISSDISILLNAGSH